MNTYQTSIVTNIRQVYERKLFSPAIYLALLLLIFNITPISELMLPVAIEKNDSISELYKHNVHYATITLQDLHFTGYTQNAWDNTSGYYYYTLYGNECIFVLLSPKTCEEGLPSIEQVTIHAQLAQNAKTYSQLTSYLAEDLDWTASSLRGQISSCIVSEPGYGRISSALLVAFYLATGFLSLISLCTCALYIRHPEFSPTCRNLGLYGNSKQLLDQAEQELATLPQLATEDMYITEHFFIAFANDRVTVIPISEILWIYKHSTLHKFLWYYFSISYTLHITARKHLYVQSPKNTKSDIDGIIDYLSEANHQILVGFSEENRRKIQPPQGFSHIGKRMFSFFNQRL